jgi:hypothetical protein
MGNVELLSSLRALPNDASVSVIYCYEPRNDSSELARALSAPAPMEYAAHSRSNPTSEWQKNKKFSAPELARGPALSRSDVHRRACCR